MPRCEICKEFIFSDSHKCPPKWETLIPDYDGDWVDSYAFSSEFAVIKRAEQYDNGEYNLLQGEDVDILVRGENGVIIRYNCTGETIPEYRATKIPEEPK